MLNQSYFHTMKFNLGDYDLGDLGLGDFSLGDLGLGDFNLDFDLIPKSASRVVFEKATAIVFNFCAIRQSPQ